MQNRTKAIWIGSRVTDPSLLTAMGSGLAAALYLSALTRAGVSHSGVAIVAMVGIAALISGVAGFAFSAVSGAILFQFRHDGVGIVETLMVCSMANQALSVWLLRQHITAGAIAPFALGGLAGVPIGVWLLLHLHVSAFSVTLGLFLIAYGVTMLLRPPVVLPKTGPVLDAAVGFAGGAIGGLTANPGAAVSVWCAMKGWDKVRQRAIFQPFVLIMQMAALIAIAAFHQGSAASLGVPSLAWVCVPAGLLGTWWGVTLFKRMPDDHFAKAINLLLIASGLALAL